MNIGISREPRAASEPAVNDNDPADLKQRVDDLLLVRVRDLELPADIASLYEVRSSKIRRAVMSAWFFWVGTINILLSGFDIFDLVPPALSVSLSARIIVSVICLLSGIMLRESYFMGREQWPVIAMSLLCIVAAGVAGHVSHQPEIAAGYLINALLVVYSVIMFINIDLRYAKLLAALAVVFIGVSMLTEGGGDVAIKLQLFTLYTATMYALLQARRIQNRFQHRLFLINLRDEMNAKETASRNAELSSIAYIDRLTDIPNRRYFDEICHAMSETTKNLMPLSVCMIDIDKFKSLNDHLGHLRGDHCLQVVANTIRNNLRGKTDILIRYGGDEFLLILPGTDRERALDVAERVLTAITDLQHSNPGSPFGIITASIGVYTHYTHPISGEMLIEHADTALYRAKSAGRNRVSA
jgi:diguanylate cyclase (GGDEF)-like protein